VPKIGTMTSLRMMPPFRTATARRDIRRQAIPQ
jgi:hypothetical protein